MEWPAILRFRAVTPGIASSGILLVLLVSTEPGTGAGPHHSSVLTVTTTRDAGPGSLRQAILDANAIPGPDTISFDLPLPGPHLISPTSALPPLTDSVTLDGDAQAGAVGPAGASAGAGVEWIRSQARPVVLIDGKGAGDAAGIVLEAGGCIVRGVAVRRFARAGIVIAGSGGNRIEGNSIEANGGPGVVVVSSAGNTIIGNVIAGNSMTRNAIAGSSMAGASIAGDSIAGVSITGDSIAGDSIAGASIAGDSIAGDSMTPSSIAETSITGGPPAGSSVAGEMIPENSPATTRGQEIDLGGDGATRNDQGDEDAGANDLQNAPFLTRLERRCCHAGPDGGEDPRWPSWSAVIEGELRSRPSSDYMIEFHSVGTQRPLQDSKFLGSATVSTVADRRAAFLGSAKVSTDADGRATFKVFLPTEAPIPSGALLMATATDPAGNTSELSEPLVAPRLTVTWDQPVSGSWSDGSKWTGGTAPGPGDDAVIAVDGTYTVTLNVAVAINSLTVGSSVSGVAGVAGVSGVMGASGVGGARGISGVMGVGGANGARNTTGAGGSQTLSMVAGLLTIANGSTIGESGILAHAAGTLTGAGTLTVAGLYDWTGGALLGAGLLNVGSGGTIQIGGSAGQTLARTVNTSGTTRWTASGALAFNSPGVFNNQSGGVFEIHGSATMSGSGIFNNAGSLVKPNGATSTFALRLNNSGTITIRSGSLVLSGGGTSSGLYDAAGTALTFGGGITNLSGGASVTAGALNVAGGTLTSSAPVTVTGATRVSAGSAVLSGSVSSLGATLTIDGGALTLNTIEPSLSVETFTQRGGSLDGGTTLTVTGTAAWEGGQMTGSGQTRIAQEGTLTIGGTGAQTLTRTLRNAGTARWTGSGPFDLVAPGVLANEAGGVFDVQNNGTMGNSGVINNAGSFIKSGGLTTTLSSAFNNTGTVDVQTGTLLLLGGGTSSGPLDATGAALIFGGGTHALGGGANLTTTNLTITGGNVSSAASVSVSGTTRVSGGTTTFSGSLPSLGTSLILTGGALTISTAGGTAALPDASQTGGVLTGSAAVTVTGSYDWSGGSMTGAGRTIVASGGALTIRGTVSLERALENAGTVGWADSGALTLTSAGTLNNQAGGMLLLQNTQRIEGAGAIDNAGSLIKNSPGVTTINTVLNNTGTVEVQAGTLLLSKGGTSTGAFNAQDAALTFGGGTHTLSGGAAINARTLNLASGSVATSARVLVGGATSVSGASVVFSGSVPGLGSPVTISSGTLDIENTEGALDIANLTQSGGLLTGAGGVTVTGTCNWGGGTMSGTGSIAIAPGAILNINGGGNLQRILHNHGGAVWTGSSPFSIGASGVFVNESDGVFSVQSAALLSGTGTFENRGTFAKSSAGATNWGAHFLNSGTVNLGSGTLTFGGGYSQSSGALVLNGGALAAAQAVTIGGGQLSGSGTISGSIVNSGGALSPGSSPGSITMAGAYTQGAAGHYAVELGGPPAGALFDRVSVSSGAALGGTLDVTFLDPFVPSIGDNFTILTFTSRTGTFATENLPPLPSDAQWNVIYKATSVVLAVERLGSGADLSLAMADSPDPVNAAGVVTYTLTVTNQGPDPAESVLLSDTLPAGATNASASGAGWSCGAAFGGKITCTRASLDVDASAPIAVSLRAPLTGPLTNAATVSSIKRDFVPENNAATETTSVTPVADLSIVTADDHDPVNRTVPLVYTLAVANAGPSAATDITVTDSLPPGVTSATAAGTGWACGPASNGTITCTRPSLSIGAAPNLLVTVTTPDISTTLVNTASVSSPVLDLISANNTDTEETTVTADPPQADLSISISDLVDPVGALAPLRYTLAVSNGGPDEASAVTVTDVLPAGVTAASASGAGWTCAPPAGGQIVCTRASLAAGASVTIDLTATAPEDGGTIIDSAGIAALTADPDGSNNQDTETTGVTPRADLAIAESDSVDPVEPGESLSYTVTVSNAGPSSASNVAVTETIPPGVSNVTVDGDGWGCNPPAAGAITCTRPVLPVGSAPHLTVSMTAPFEIGVLANRVTVSSPVSDPRSVDNTAIETTTVQPVGSLADLALALAAAPDPVTSGATLTYTLSVANAGPNVSANVTLTQALPAGVSNVTASGTGWTCLPPSGGSLVCNRSYLLTGSAPAITVTLRAPASGPLATSATVGAVTEDPDLANNTASASTVVTTVADLSIAQTDSPDPVDAGGALTYTLTVVNGGPSTATNLSVTETLPSGATNASATGSGWNCTAQPRETVASGSAPSSVIACTRATLPIGSAPPLIVTLTAPPSGPLSAEASVSALTLDPHPGNNTATATTAVTPLADLSTSQTDAPDPVAAAGTLTYTLTVANAGPSTALAVTVTDSLPQGVTGATASGPGWSCGPPSAGTLSCARASLGTGSAPPITLTLTAPGSAAVLVNATTVSATTADPNAANNASSQETHVEPPVPQADLSLTKSDAEDPVETHASIAWTVTVTNAGPDPADTITVTDTLPAGVTAASATGDGWSCDPPSSGHLVCVLSGLAAQSFSVLEVTALAPPVAGTVSNVATVSAATSDPDGANNGASEPTTVLPPVALADLSIALTDSPDPVSSGGVVTYSIVVTNAGPDAANNLSVTDTLPAGVSDLTASGDGWTCGTLMRRANAGGEVESGTPAGGRPVGGALPQWTIAAMAPDGSPLVCTRTGLAPGSAPPITLTVTAPADQAILTNRAIVASATADPNTADNQGTAETSVLPPLVDADLSIAQSDSPDPVNAGGVVTYTLVVTNAGPHPASDLTVIDTLPAGVSGASASGDGWTCGAPSDGAIACTRPSLAPESAPAIILTLTAPASGLLTNTTVVTAVTNDPSPSDNTDVENTTIATAPTGADLAIALVEPQTSVVAGQSLTYTLAVTNAGPDTASKVTVTNTLSGGVTIGRVTASGWKCGPSPGAVTCKRSSLAVGETSQITIPLRAPGIAGTITGTAAVSSTTPDPFADNNSRDESTSVTPVYDIAVLAMRAPKSVTLAVPDGLRRELVSVQIENRSPHDETIPDLARLGTLVSLTVHSLGACPDLPATLVAGPPQSRLPRTLRPLDRMTVWFEILFTSTCVNDPLRSSTRLPGHEDYAYIATVNHAAGGSEPDSHPSDDVCPRQVSPPYVIDPYPFGVTQDRGCGKARGDRTFGDPVLTDIVGR